jgi:hypothetical protein
MSTSKNNKNYLNSDKTFEDLKFKKTIHFFNTVNAIYLLFKENQKTKSTTKKTTSSTKKTK